MKKWTRARFMPNKPLYDGKRNVTSCQEHLQLCCQAAREGMVLLKNEQGLLPFRKNQRVAAFGKGLFDYVKGGGGSGDVSVAYVYNLYDGFAQLKDSICFYQPLVDYYRAYVEKEYAGDALPGLMSEAELPDELLQGARAYTDTAMIILSRFSGEGWDRKSVYYEGQEPSERQQSQISERIFGESDYYLSPEEAHMIAQVEKYYDRIVLVLNVGGVVDSSWFKENEKISSVLLAWQGGMMGGLATAELLMGQDSPSGKLPDTFAASLEDYPSTESFHQSPYYVDYTEDIYVGYRYFETIPGQKEKVNYAFGYGLSYTEYEIDCLMACSDQDKVYLTARVENIGSRAGKEVLMAYMEAPQGKLGKARRSLVAYEKTKKLQPGESQLLTLEIPYDHMTSYDDLGKVAKSAYLLEKGTYHFYLGSGLDDLPDQPSYSMELSEDRILCQCQERCAPEQLAERMLADGSMEALPLREPTDYEENALGPAEAWMDGVAPILRGQPRSYKNWFLGEKDPGHIDLIDVYEEKASMDEYLKQFTDLELADLLGGQPNQGIANTFGFGNNPTYGVPSLMTTDGPAGVRILPDYEIYTTQWPCATQLASTWNRSLLYEIGRMAGEEVKENNLSVWLAPAVNIHRNPLCGRNFEYYSEDPYLTGEMAAAMIKGVQSMGVAATVKHFACNNKETNRRDSDSRLSERALREIYLKQFEIIIKEADPWVVMSSYNLTNGVRTSECKELLEGILRQEWGYDGVVCSDWYTKGEHYKELLAGNDIKMGTGYPERLMEALELGAICREDMLHSATRVLRMIMKVE